jgi:hypothetical protein
MKNKEKGGACGTRGLRRDTYGVLVGKLEGQRPQGRPIHRWKNNIKIGLQEINVRALTGLVWLRIDTTGGHLLKRE